MGAAPLSRSSTRVTAVKALCVLKHPGVVRNLESTLKLLAARGHAVVLAFESTKSSESVEYVQRLVAETTGFSIVDAPSSRGYSRYGALAHALRATSDYLRYLEPRYRNASALRERAGLALPTAVRLLTERVAGGSGRRLGVVQRLLRAVERSLPPRPETVDFIRTERPDVLLVSPLVGLASAQADYIRAAQRLGIHTAFPVLSWDNLTNKGLLRDVPDLTIVWNEAQAAEAVELHGVPRDRIACVGAASYDHWFSWEPSRGREELCRDAGLRPDRPFVLYVCSSPFIAPVETHFVDRWVAGLRNQGGELAELGVLVRPHPQNAAQWWDYDPPEGVAVWPRRGEDPLDRRTRANYFDSLYHCAAVVGINTSALIESAIVDRPVLTILDPEFAGTQEGTLHFHHLSQPGSGPLVVARTLGEHRVQLLRVLNGEDDFTSRNERFVTDFVRPRGRDEPAANFAVEAIERLVAGERPDVNRSVVGWLRPLLLPLDLLARAQAGRREKARKRRSDAETAAHQRARDAVRAAAASTGPVLVGPWLSDIGHELLYWIPFLRWAVTEEPTLSGRVVAASRGGVASWYDDISGSRYVEVLEHLTAPDFRDLDSVAEQEGLTKRMHPAELDVRLRAAVERTTGAAVDTMIHPAVLFDAQAASHKLGALTKVAPLFPIERIRPPEIPELEERLPTEFVVLHFVFDARFPRSAENVHLVRRVTERLSGSTQLVWLDGSLDPEVAPDGHPFIAVDDLVTPSTRLAVQTAATARARALVATEGGLSFLPPLLGIDSIALYDQPERLRHRHLVSRLKTLDRSRFGSYVAINARRPDAVDAVLASVGVPERSPAGAVTSR